MTDIYIVPIVTIYFRLSYVRLIYRFLRIDFLAHFQSFFSAPREQELLSQDCHVCADRKRKRRQRKETLIGPMSLWV